MSRNNKTIGQMDEKKVGKSKQYSNYDDERATTGMKIFFGIMFFIALVLAIKIPFSKPSFKVGHLSYVNKQQINVSYVVPIENK